VIDVDFEALFEDHFDAIYGYLARRVGQDLARDLAAETFTRGYAGRKRFDPERGEPRAWLFGIANNLLRRHYRDEERRLQAFARIDEPRAEAAQDEQPVAEALAVLSREERDALLLFAWADLSYEQIAEALALPIGTVRSRLNRARTRMRDELTKAGAVNG
jgi:RNA polymerase sigma-70 factor (ECF subfamily)